MNRHPGERSDKGFPNIIHEISRYARYDKIYYKNYNLKQEYNGKSINKH